MANAVGLAAAPGPDRCGPDPSTRLSVVETGTRPTARTRAISLACLLACSLVIVTARQAGAEGRPHNAFRFHLECDGGATYEITVLSDDSLASLVEGLRSVAVVKGFDFDFDGALDIMLGAQGFAIESLAACEVFQASGSADGSSTLFVAYVLFTPRST
jgi:hypothetical protein